MKRKHSLKGKQMLSAVMAAMLLMSGVTPVQAAEVQQEVVEAAAEKAAAQVEELKILINGQEVSETNPFYAEGSCKGRAYVKAKYTDSAEFVDVSGATFSWVKGPGDIRKDTGEFFSEGEGEITYKASFGGKDILFKVVVGKVPVKSISVKVPSTWAIHDWNGLGGYYVGITKGNSDRQFSYVVEPGNASNKNLVWENLTPEIAEYMEAFGNGIVPKKAGAARFKVSSESNPEVSQEVSVNFVYKNPLKEAKAEQGTYTIKKGDFQEILIHATPVEASEQRFEWTYSVPDIVKVTDSVSTNPDSVTIPKKTTHTLEALEAGEVTVTGTPLDTTAGCKPVTFDVTVTGPDGAINKAECLQMTKDDIAHGLANINHAKLNKYGAEWDIFVTLRAGKKIDQNILDQYYKSVGEKLNAGLKKMKITDGARVAIALSAMGKDLTNVESVNLIDGLCNDKFRFKMEQDTSNAPIFTLIALDAQNVTEPEGAIWTRDKLIARTLTYQKANGGFGLNSNDNIASVDMTAMALQALAPYNNGKHPEVQSAVEKGLNYIKERITPKAGYADMDGSTENSNSGAQVLTALSALGIDPLAEENGFTKGNYNLISNLDSYKKDGGFCLRSGASADGMSTQQVSYALEAYRRFAENENSLYDMTDITVTDPQAEANKKAADAVIEKINAIGKVTLESKTAIADARAEYDKLTEAQKKLVTNVAVLTEAEAKLKELEAQKPAGKEVIVTIEKFTIGRGYQVEPKKIILDKESRPREILKTVAGDAYKEGGYGGFKGIEDSKLKQDNITVPAYISEKLGGPTTEKAIQYAKKQSSWDTILESNDYADNSAWTCMINNKVVKSDPYNAISLETKVDVKPGDVIRFQFSIAEGQDIDGIKLWTPDNKLIDISNKDELTKLMADVNADRAKWMAYPSVKAAYEEAVTAISGMITPQKEIDAATAKLKAAMVNSEGEENQKAADAVIEKINAIGTVILESKAEIEVVRAEFEKLTEAQKKLVTNVNVLEAAEKELKKLEDEKAQAEADQKAADAVIAKINAIGTVTLESKAAIKAARTEYDKLSVEQRKLVNNYEILTKAEEEFKKLEEEASKGHVVISVERFTIGQGYFKEPVRVPFEKGDNAATLLKKVIGAENFVGKDSYLEAIEGADLGVDKVVVPDYIAKLSKNGVTTETARAHGNDDTALGQFDYSGMSGWMYHVNGKEVGYGISSYVPKDGDVLRFQFTMYGYGTDLTGYMWGNPNPLIVISNKDNLTTKMAEVNENRSRWMAVPTVKAVYNEAVEAASAVITPKEEIDALTQKLEKAMRDQEKLEAADKKAAEEVNSLISKLNDKVTLEDKKDIEAARAAYEALTDNQKKLVNNITKLIKAEEEIKVLEGVQSQQEADKNLAKIVEDLISKLNEKVTLEDKKDIEAARIAYEELSENQKKLVSNLSKLEKSEKALKNLEEAQKQEEADKKAAKEVENLIKKLNEKVTLEDKKDIQKARAAYDKLTESQKKLVDNLDKLVKAEETLKALEEVQKPEEPTPEEEKQVVLVNKKYGLTLQAEGLTDCMELSVTPIGKGNKNVEAMRKEIPSNKSVFRLYDVKLMKNGKEIQLPAKETRIRKAIENSVKAILSIPVGKDYEGKELTLLLSTDGKVEKLTGKVKNEMLSVELSKLGSVGVVIDTPASNGASGSVGGSTANSGNGGSSPSKGSAAKTGDETQTGMLILMLMLSATAMGTVVYKKKTLNK